MSVYSIISVVFGLTVLLTVPEQYILFVSIMYVFIFIYHCYIHKRLFKLSAKQLILKTLLFLVIGFILYIGLSILGVLTLMLTGVIELQDFVPKH
jgi:hypothetical protein